jgi:hypothetical protein
VTISILNTTNSSFLNVIPTITETSTNVKSTLVLLKSKMNGEMKYAQISVMSIVNVTSMSLLVMELGLVKILKT